MSKKQLKLLAALLASLLLMCGCFDPNLSNPTFDGDLSDSEVEVITVPPYNESENYTYLTQVDERIFTTGKSSEYLVLVNKLCSLDADYAPASLVRLGADIVISWQEKLGGLYLEPRTAAALVAMITEMKTAGINDIWVTSAYRDYAYQANLFDGYILEEMSTISSNAVAYFGEDYINNNYWSKNLYKLSLEDARKVVLSYSAAPGTSEHQTGLCLDFTTTKMQGNLTEKFEEEPAFAWLSQNAYKFGFILRYPQSKVAITGYSYEPWHYRFVGREVATDIYYSGLSLEEYLIAVQN